MTLAFADERVSGNLAAPTDTTTARPRFLRVLSGNELDHPEQPEMAEALATAAATSAAIAAQARQLTKRHPKSPSAYARLAHAELQAGHRDEATQAARRAVGLAVIGSDPSALTAAAIVLAAVGERQTAEEALQRAPGAGYSNLYAQFAVERGEYRTALARLEGQDDPASLGLRGWLLICLNDYAAAIRTFRRIIADEGPSSDVLINLGYAYAALGSRHKALRATEVATHLAPADRTAAFNLAKFRSASGDTDGALKELRRIEQFHPDDLKISFAVAAHRIRGGNLEGAARELSSLRSEPRAWRADPQDRAQLRANIAVLDFSLGRRDRKGTMQAIRKALEATEYRNVAIAELLATFYVSRRDLSTLQELYAALLRVHRSTDLFSLEVRLAILKGDYSRAETISYQWMKDDPFDSEAAAFATYLTAEWSQDYDAAVRTGVEALRRLPDSELIANNIACAHALAGRPQEARRFLPKDRNLPHIIATAALIDLASGAIERGRGGYEEAAILAEKKNEHELADLIRFRGKLALIQCGAQGEPMPIELPARYDDDARFILLRDAACRSLKERSSKED